MQQDELAKAIRLLGEEKASMLSQCTLLEKMADSLPSAFLLPNVTQILGHTERSLKRHIELQEGILFPCLRALQPEHVTELLAQCEYEHASDTGLIVEIIEAAMDGHLGGQNRAVVFGCLLRQFFEGQRRHLAWESESLRRFVSVLPQTYWDA